MGSVVCKVTHSVAWGRAGRVVPVKHIQTNCRISIPGASSGDTENVPRKSREKKMVVPDSDPPSLKNIDLLHQFFEMSPNGAYSSGFQPITHQEVARSKRARRRYWARSFAGWRKFTAARPGAAHHALASFEKAGRIKFMITQNVDRLHHHAGSDPLELHGTVYTVMCIDYGHSFSRGLLQVEVKALNPKVGFCFCCLNKLRWAAAIESLEQGSPGSDFGMKQRPYGYIEIDENFLSFLEKIS